METKTKEFPPVAIIGLGGVGSCLLPILLRTIRNHKEPNKSPQVILYDGDKLEPRNMERQLFKDSDVGKFKCEALAETNREYYPNLVAVPEFFNGGETLPPECIVIVAVDNHPGRVRALSAADRGNHRAILCGNGYTDAEAFFYHPAWKDGPLDPLKYHPEILVVKDGDPLQPAGCTGVAQTVTPQLAIANMGAAYYALHLLWFWTQEEDKLTEDFRMYVPIKHSNNFTACATKRSKDHS